MTFAVTAERGNDGVLALRDKRWNFAACLTDAVGWPLGAALISLQTIFPVFLGHLGAGNVAVGALTAMYNLLLFLPGLGVAGYISRLRRARGYLFWVALAERLALVPLALLTLLWGPTHPHWLLAAVFVCIGFHAAMMGLNQPAYWVVVGKCVPAHWRGRLFGYAGGVAGLLGLGVAGLLHRSLSGPAGGFPNGYGHLFFLAFAVLTVSVLPLGVVREPDRPPAPNSGGDRGATWAIWRTDTSFRRFLYAQIAGALAALATPFFVLDAVGRLHGGSSVPGDTATLVLAAAFGGLAWGAWGDHGGNRRVLLAASACLACAPVLALYAPSALGVLRRLCPVGAGGGGHRPGGQQHRDGVRGNSTKYPTLHGALQRRHGPAPRRRAPAGRPAGRPPRLRAGVLAGRTSGPGEHAADPAGARAAPPNDPLAPHYGGGGPGLCVS